MENIREKSPGLLCSFLLGLAAYLLGGRLPMIGGPVFAILIGMVIAVFWKKKGGFQKGIAFTSKYVLQLAVVLLGFGLNLNVILKTGAESLPIIICTISTSLLLALVMHRLLKTSGNAAILVGVGSSICGGSAIAATAPVIDASDDEVAQSISVIFLFNVIAAVLFPLLGQAIGMDTTTGNAFGIFAGTAVNDTSSVTATAATWDNLFHLGSATLDKAVTVKLTRTLAIIPITLVLAYFKAKKRKAGDGNGSSKFRLRRAFPMFILYFVMASLITTAAGSFGVSSAAFTPLKKLSKFFIIMAMGAIGLNSDIVKLIKTGGKPLTLGAVCWIGISTVSLLLQHVLGIW